MLAAGLDGGNTSISLPRGYMAFNAVETVRFERSEAPDGETWGTTELGCTFIEWDYKIEK